MLGLLAHLQKLALRLTDFAFADSVFFSLAFSKWLEIHKGQKPSQSLSAGCFYTSLMFPKRVDIWEGEWWWEEGNRIPFGSSEEKSCFPKKTKM